MLTISVRLLCTCIVLGCGLSERAEVDGTREGKQADCLDASQEQLNPPDCRESLSETPDYGTTLNTSPKVQRSRSADNDAYAQRDDVRCHSKPKTARQKPNRYKIFTEERRLQPSKTKPNVSLVNVLPQFFKLDKGNQTKGFDIDSRQVMSAFDILKDVLSYNESKSKAGSDQHPDIWNSLFNDMELVNIIAKCFSPDGNKTNFNRPTEDVERRPDDYSHGDLSQDKTVLSTERYTTSNGTVKVLVGKWDLEKSKNRSDAQNAGATPKYYTDSTCSLPGFLYDVATEKYKSLPVGTCTQPGTNWNLATAKATVHVCDKCSRKWGMALKELNPDSDVTASISGPTTKYSCSTLKSPDSCLDFIRILQTFSVTADCDYRNDISTKVNIFMSDNLTERGTTEKQAYLEKYGNSKSFTLTTPGSYSHPVTVTSPKTSVELTSGLKDDSFPHSTIAYIKYKTSGTTGLTLSDTISPTKSKAHKELVKIFDSFSPVSTEINGGVTSPRDIYTTAWLSQRKPVEPTLSSTVNVSCTSELTSDKKEIDDFFESIFKELSTSKSEVSFLETTRQVVTTKPASVMRSEDYSSPVTSTAPSGSVTQLTTGSRSSEVTGSSNKMESTTLPRTVSPLPTPLSTNSGVTADNLELVYKPNHSTASGEGSKKNSNDKIYAPESSGGRNANKIKEIKQMLATSTLSIEDDLHFVTNNTSASKYLKYGKTNAYKTGGETATHSPSTSSPVEKSAVESTTTLKLTGESPSDTSNVTQSTQNGTSTTIAYPSPDVSTAKLHATEQNTAASEVFTVTPSGPVANSTVTRIVTDTHPTIPYKESPTVWMNTTSNGNNSPTATSQTNEQQTPQSTVTASAGANISSTQSHDPSSRSSTYMSILEQTTSVLLNDASHQHTSSNAIVFTTYESTTHSNTTLSTAASASTEHTWTTTRPYTLSDQISPSFETPTTTTSSSATTSSWTTTSPSITLSGAADVVTPSNQNETAASTGSTPSTAATTYASSVGNQMKSFSEIPFFTSTALSSSSHSQNHQIKPSTESTLSTLVNSEITKIPLPAGEPVEKTIPPSTAPDNKEPSTTKIYGDSLSISEIPVKLSSTIKPLNEIPLLSTTTFRMRATKKMTKGSTIKKSQFPYKYTLKDDFSGVSTTVCSAIDSNINDLCCVMAAKDLTQSSSKYNNDTVTLTPQSTTETDTVSYDAPTTKLTTTKLPSEVTISLSVDIPLLFTRINIDLDAIRSYTTTTPIKPIETPTTSQKSKTSSPIWTNISPSLTDTVVPDISTTARLSLSTKRESSLGYVTISQGTHQNSSPVTPNLIGTASDYVTKLVPEYNNSTEMNEPVQLRTSVENTTTSTFFEPASPPCEVRTEETPEAEKKTLELAGGGSPTSFDFYGLRAYNSSMTVRQYVADISEKAAAINNKNMIAQWNHETNITHKNYKIAMVSTLELIHYQRIQNQFLDTLRDVQIYDPMLEREIKLLYLPGMSILPDIKIAVFEEMIYAMDTIFSSASVIAWNNPHIRYHLPEVKRAMSVSNIPEELSYYWSEWRNVTGRKLRRLYEQYVELMNLTAISNGFCDASEMWTREYETEDFMQLMGCHWEEIRPLYLELHAYVRCKLHKHYGDVTMTNDYSLPIPAHLVGDLWGQTWRSLFNITRPYERVFDSPSMDIRSKGYTTTKMALYAEAFFSSLGFPSLPEVFWKNSILTKQKTDMSCEPTAWDMCDGKDFRIKMCSNGTLKDFFDIHHELTHVEYFIQYKDLSFPFRSGPNPGFHEAVAGTILLSVENPYHLSQVGLVPKSKNRNADVDINYLLRVALDKVAFLPYSYIVDLWRYKVFKGDIKPNDYNKRWWELRLQYQGLAPPNQRTEEDFDPGCKFHIAGNKPYIQNFLSTILQFQFHEALCRRAGLLNGKTPLHNCDISNSHDAGTILRRVMAMGATQHWRVAMYELTGTRQISSKGLVEFFKPLLTWLRKENLRNGQKIGWKNTVNLF